MSLESLPEEVAGGDVTAYRRALGAFATGVCVVTADSARGPLGITINSFTSVSLAPPMVLWCLGLAARRRPVFASAPSVAGRIRAEDQRSLLGDLARPLESRLKGVPIRDGVGGAPVIENAAAVFECAIATVTRAGDHEIYLGQVERFEHRDDTPLAYLAGQYGRVHVAA